MATTTLYLNSIELATSFVPQLLMVVVGTSLLIGVALKFLRRV